MVISSYCVCDIFQLFSITTDAKVPIVVLPRHSNRPRFDYYISLKINYYSPDYYIKMGVA